MLEIDLPSLLNKSITLFGIAFQNDIYKHFLISHPYQQENIIFQWFLKHVLEQFMVKVWFGSGVNWSRHKACG